MKLILLVGGPRAGLDLFQSLLDNHEEILQFPGVIYINNKLKEILTNKSKKKIAQNFIKEYSHFFDSRKTNIERHYMLGKKKNKFYKVDNKKFIKRFIILSKKKKLFKDVLYENLFLLHKAYDLGNNKHKIIVINAHIIPFVFNFEKLFRGINFEIIHTIRHPLSSISSTVKNWLNYKRGIYLRPKELYYNLDVIVFGIQKLRKLNKKIHIIQLENMHRNVNSVMKHFCKIYSLKFQKCLVESTYHNLKWWGDKISGKDLNGVNKNFKITYDENLFKENDLAYFRYILQEILKKYKYKINSRKLIKFHFKPLSCELMAWKKTIQNKQIKHSFSIMYFYLKRIFKFNKLFISNKFLPNTILLKK